ncbi:MAG: fibronectin type III domain-containing protein [Acidimicrobiia bacterium]
MSHTFRKTLALSASVAVLAAAVLALAASPASATTPPAPTGVSVTVASVNSVNVYFTGDGQADAIFAATCTTTLPGGLPVALPVVMGTSSPILVTGITNLPSQTISCQVDETVGGVTSPCSNPAGVSMTGVSGPGCVAALTAPTGLSVAPGEMSATVSWAPVISNPPGCIQGYVVTPSGSGTPLEVLGPFTTTVIYGLTDGASVTVTVAAANGGGVGPASVSTSPIIIGAPAAPSVISASRVARDALTVAFSAPASNGLAINGYAVRCRSSNGGAPRTTLGRTSPIQVKRLTPGKTYTCAVVAANGLGSSPASATSAPVRA